jgi:hypothetical protein
MNVRQFNWPLYVGFLFVLIAVFSYPAVFVWSPVTRDFPWVNLLLFVVALFLCGKEYGGDLRATGSVRRFRKSSRR